jgi:hypothetical protein
MFALRDCQKLRQADVSLEGALLFAGHSLRACKDLRTRLR